MNVVSSALLLTLATIGWTFPQQQVNPDAHIARGITYSKQGDLDGAIAEFREANRLKPDSISGHSNLGKALESKGALQAALREYRTAHELDRSNTETLYDYARLSVKVRHKVEASISGLIQDSSLVPISSVKVTLVSRTTLEVLSTTYSNPKGIFAISFLKVVDEPISETVLRCEKEGYQPVELSGDEIYTKSSRTILQKR